MDASEKPGFIVSSTAHAAILLLALFSFSRTPKFEDAQETIPIDLVTSQDVNQIMQGDKTAKQVQPKQRADKIADVTERKPKPPIADAKRDVPTPPPPLKRIADPGEADKVEPPKPPTRVAALPPPPMKTPPLPPLEDKPPPPDAEAIDSKPKQVQAKKDERKKSEAKKLQQKFKLDQIAKLLDDVKTDPKTVEKSAKLKSGDDSKEPRKFSADDISRLLSREAPQRRAASARELQQVASLGSPTANAPRLSPSLQAAMDGWFQDHFQGCWIQPITLPQGPKYVPEIRVPLNVDGSLSADPTLVNPPDDPAWQPLAESAMRAVRKCDPLPVPDQFKPYYDTWRDRIVRFNDQDS